MPTTGPHRRRAFLRHAAAAISRHRPRSSPPKKKPWRWQPAASTRRSSGRSLLCHEFASTRPQTEKAEVVLSAGKSPSSEPASRSSAAKPAMLPAARSSAPSSKLHATGSSLLLKQDKLGIVVSLVSWSAGMPMALPSAYSFRYADGFALDVYEDGEESGVATCQDMPTAIFAEGQQNRRQLCICRRLSYADGIFAVCRGGICRRPNTVGIHKYRRRICMPTAF